MRDLRFYAPALIFLGCTQKPLPVPVVPDVGGHVTFTRVFRNFDGPFGDSLRLVISTDSGWRQLVAHLGEHRPRTLPTPDFSRQTALVGALGPLMSESRWITFDSLRASGETLRVFLRKPEFAPGCLIASSVSAPVDVILADTAGLHVEFVERRVTVDCLGRDSSRRR